MDIRAQMLVFFFSRMLSTLTEVLGRDIRANDPRMSAGYLARKLPLWADYWFLILGPKMIAAIFSPTSENRNRNGRNIAALGALSQ